MSKRRDFVKKTSLAAGLLATGFPLISSNQKERLKIGVIGTGSRGEGLTRLIKGIDGMDVVACCDVLPFRLENGLKHAAENAKGYDDYRYLLGDPSIDAVVIATPFNMHDEMCIDAIAAGKHIYCEKTMAKGIAEIQRVLDAYAEANSIFQTGHQYHSSPLYQEAIQTIQSGQLGEITAFDCQWNRNGDWRRPVNDPDLERIINWRMYREYSGGLMAELCSHQVDFINWALGEIPEKVAGFGGIDHWKDGRETFDNLHVLFEYPSGVNANFTCTTTNAFEDYKIKVMGKKATMILGYNKGVIYLEPTKEKNYGTVDGVSGATRKAWEMGMAQVIDAPGNDPTIDALKQFYESVVDDQPVISTIQTGANTAKCVQIALDAMYDEEVKYWTSYPELKF